MRQPKPGEERLRWVGVSINGGEGALPPPQEGEEGKPLPKGESGEEKEEKAKQQARNGEKRRASEVSIVK